MHKDAYKVILYPPAQRTIERELIKQTGMKTCTRCGVSKPVSLFRKDKGRCKQCLNTVRKAHRAKSKPPKYCKECGVDIPTRNIMCEGCAGVRGQNRRRVASKSRESRRKRARQPGPVIPFSLFENISLGTIGFRRCHKCSCIKCKTQFGAKAKRKKVKQCYECAAEALSLYRATCRPAEKLCKDCGVVYPNTVKYFPAKGGGILDGTPHMNHRCNMCARVYKNSKRVRRKPPAWLSEEDFMKIIAIYREVYIRRMHGEKVVVDHIEPIKGKLAWGMHVPWNLQILSQADNAKKHNLSNAAWEALKVDSRTQ